MANLVLPVAGIVAVVACAAGGQAMRPSPAVQTLSVSQLARDLAPTQGHASFRGRTVRVCHGRLEQVTPAALHRWELLGPERTYPYGASVLVQACTSARPALDSAGCLVGRVARRDGSIRNKAPGDGEVITAHTTISHTWYLHPQCPSRR
jgi:hypothetical protein